MLDIMTKVDTDNKCKYVWFDTGLEYQATKDHIKYLEDEYGIAIEKCKPKKPIPVAVREYGVPFLSKEVSQKIDHLQRHGFQWEDEPYEVLSEKYHHCKSELEWWCNKKTGAFGIKRNKYLKEFLMQYPPNFKISQKCCTYAKKNVAHDFNKSFKTDLECVGIRKSEGGVRATAYKSCYDSYDNKWDRFRPIFWYSDTDKKYYENHFSIIHSDCYKVWGMTRTGCCGCPYNRDLERDLELIKQYEPKLYKACNNIFGESYEYTRKYREFQKMMKEKEKNATDI